MNSLPTRVHWASFMFFALKESMTELCTLRIPNDVQIIGNITEIKFDNTNYTIVSFLGIQFAQDEVFSKPKVIDFRIGSTLNATNFGSNCDHIYLKPIHMFHNCLYLNIYIHVAANSKMSSESKTNARSTNVQNTHDVTSILKSEKRAVFIYIHGGEYFHGSGSYYSGACLAGVGGIILVTINYRLGPFGFLNTEDDVIPGNLGLWDQQAAIQWVHKYIEGFGGDPSRITVGGQSAGSYSALLQGMYEPNDKLFHRIIAQSGTPLARGSINKVGYKTALALANSLGCSIKDDKKRSAEIKNCLLTKDLSDLNEVELPNLVLNGLPLEPSLDNDFIKSDPYDDKKKETMAHFAKKDLLIGTDAQDGEESIRLWAYKAPSNAKFLKSYLTKDVIKKILFECVANLPEDKPAIYDNVYEAILDKYINPKDMENLTIVSNKAVAIATDVLFLLPSIDTASLHSGPASGSTYLYIFHLPFTVRAFGRTLMPWFQGTSHEAEIDYVFGKEKTPDDVMLSKFIMTRWSNFVKTGNPNMDTDSGKKNTYEKWLPFTNAERRYMDISYIRQMKPLNDSEIRRFWYERIPEMLGSFPAKASQHKSTNGKVFYAINKRTVFLSLVVFALLN